MSNLNLLDSLEFHSPSITEGTFPSYVEKKIRSVRNKAAAGIWHVGLATLASGFGKGALAVAGVLIAGGALLMGTLTASGLDVFAFTPEAIQGGFLEGATAGGIMGTQAIATFPGMIAMGLGGLGGAYLTGHTQKQNIQEELERAEQRARQQEMQQSLELSLSRQKQLENALMNNETQTQAFSTDTPQQTQNNMRSFSERYSARGRVGGRNNGAEAIIDDSPSPESFVARELERRAEAELREAEPGVNHV